MALPSDKLEKRASFRGALFDMDGLLLDSERASMAAFEDTTQNFGLPPMPEVALACIGLRADGVRATVSAALAGRLEYDVFHADWGKRISCAFAQGIPVKAGAFALLDGLKARGIPCAVATSTRTAAAKAHLARAGLRDYFAAVIGGEQVVRGKPAPDIYLKAAEVLGVAARDCAAFEDSDPGTLAAIAAGAIVVQVPDVKAPSMALQANGHVIAATLLAGAREIGLHW